MLFAVLHPPEVSDAVKHRVRVRSNSRQPTLSRYRASTSPRSCNGYTTLTSDELHHSILQPQPCYASLPVNSDAPYPPSTPLVSLCPAVDIVDANDDDVAVGLAVLVSCIVRVASSPPGETVSLYRLNAAGSTSGKTLPILDSAAAELVEASDVPDEEADSSSPWPNASQPALRPLETTVERTFSRL